jgi:hypothetical protein
LRYSKGQCRELFASGFFHESSSPTPLKILLGTFQIFFSKIHIDIHKSRCTTGINDTDGKFAIDTTGAADTGGKFDIGVNFTSGKMPQVSMTPVENLPPMSTSPAANNGNNIRLITP